MRAHLDAAGHAALLHPHHRIRGAGAHRRGHRVAAGDLGHERALRVDLGHARARGERPLHGHIAYRLARRVLGLGREPHHVPGPHAGGRRLDRQLGDRVRYHLYGESRGRRTSRRGDVCPPRCHGVHRAVWRHGGDTEVARGERHRVVAHVIVLGVSGAEEREMGADHELRRRRRDGHASRGLRQDGDHHLGHLLPVLS